MLTNLEGLTTAELSSLRAALIPRAREARKKAIAAIFAADGLKDAWTTYMRGTPKDLTEEQKQVIRLTFESTLARYPDAYCKQMLANYYLDLEANIQREMIRRSALRPQKGTKGKVKVEVETSQSVDESGVESE
jgi:transposase